MLDVAKVTPDDYVSDLGSGDGRMVIAAAKRGARALGIEYNPDMVELSRRDAGKAAAKSRNISRSVDTFSVRRYSSRQRKRLFIFLVKMGAAAPWLCPRKPSTNETSRLPSEKE
jgi:SAM-dependent methyltransferase